LRRKWPVIILIADDDPEFRDQLKRLLGHELEARLVQAGDGDEAVRLAHEFQPDVVLMDISMPRMGGLEATRRIKAERPETKVIVVTVHDQEPYRAAARESGGDAFVLKKAVPADLIPAIRSLVRRQ